MGEQPDEPSAVNNWPLNGHGGNIIRTAVAMLKQQAEYQQLNVGYSYVVQCQSTEDVAPTKKEIVQCSPHVDSSLVVSKPGLIVALGATVMKRLGIKAKHKDVRGKILDNFKYKTPVLVTFSEKALIANPGLFESFKLDLKNAFYHVTRPTPIKLSLEQISKDYVLPTTVDDAVAVCNRILKYHENNSADNWAVSIDTETTTLHPEKKTAKIIAFCIGWGKGLATTILYDHPNASEEYLERLPEVKHAIARVLASPKPKIFHHAKYDLKFLELKYGFQVNNVIWDTLLGEHLLDEDKKGNYGLKVLTAGWLPSYCGYEDKLQDILSKQEGISPIDAIDKEISDLTPVIRREYPDFLKALETYKEELEIFDKKYHQYTLDKEDYDKAIEEYDFRRSHLAGRQAVWGVEIQDWPKGKKGKPKKPVKKFNKPKKPKLPKKPKKPKDPRSKKEQQIFKDAGFENVPVHDLQVYGAVDADVTRQLCRLQSTRIKHEKSKVAKLMRSHAIPASRVLGRMEYEGMRVDQNYVEVLDVALRKIVEETEGELYDMAGRKKADGSILNINHPGTLAGVLYNKGWTHPDGSKMPPYTAEIKTKTGQDSTAESALRSFIEYEDEENTVPTKESYFLERLLKYRKAFKALNTFLANVRALSKRDGLLHTQFHLNGTGTGRLSSSDMNMQNLPKFLAGWNIKKLFIPDNDDHVIVNVDYKGAEVRVFTAYAHDQGLIDAINDGQDMHCFFAHKVYDKPYAMFAGREDASIVPDAATRKELSKERDRIKRVVFGILYGAGPYKISETIGISIEEAKELIEYLYEMFPAIKKYADDIEVEVARNRYVETHFGRRRRFPISFISRHKSRAYRQARNFKIQSTSSDIVVAQIIEIDDPLRNEFPGARMLLTVHDSMVFQFPKKYLHQLSDFVYHYAEKRVNEKYEWLPVPFKADVHVGPNYGEGQPIDDYLAQHDFSPNPEGIVEEDELLNELRNAPFIQT